MRFKGVRRVLEGLRVCEIQRGVEGLEGLKVCEIQRVLEGLRVCEIQRVFDGSRVCEIQRGGRVCETQSCSGSFGKLETFVIFHAE